MSHPNQNEHELDIGHEKEHEHELDIEHEGENENDHDQHRDPVALPAISY